jgi:hypothetical protein
MGEMQSHLSVIVSVNVKPSKRQSVWMIETQKRLVNEPFSWRSEYEAISETVKTVAENLPCCANPS